MIPSQSDLFKGMLIEEPLEGKVAGYDSDDYAIYECPYCGNRATSWECDVIGAEPGCLFCNACNREFA